MEDTELLVLQILDQQDTEETQADEQPIDVCIDFQSTSKKYQGRILPA